MKFNGWIEIVKFDGLLESLNLVKCDVWIGDRMIYMVNIVCFNCIYINYMYINVILRRLGGIYINY